MKKIFLLIGITISIVFYIILNNMSIQKQNNLLNDYEYTLNYGELSKQEIKDTLNIELSGYYDLYDQYNNITYYIGPDFKYKSSMETNLFTYYRILNKRVVYLNDFDDLKLETYIVKYRTNNENEIMKKDYVHEIASDFNRTISSSTLLQLILLIASISVLSTYIIMNNEKRRLVIYFLNGLSQNYFVKYMIKRSIVYILVGMFVGFIIVELIYTKYFTFSTILYIYDFIALLCLGVVVSLLYIFIYFISSAFLLRNRWTYYLKDFNNVRINIIISTALYFFVLLLCLQLFSINALRDGYNNSVLYKTVDKLNDDFYQIKELDRKLTSDEMTEIFFSSCNKNLNFLLDENETVNSKSINTYSCIMNYSMFEYFNDIDLDNKVYAFNSGNNKDIVTDNLLLFNLDISNKLKDNIVMSEKYINYYNDFYGYDYYKTTIFVFPDDVLYDIMTQHNNEYNRISVFGWYVKKDSKISSLIYSDYNIVENYSEEIFQNSVLIFFSSVLIVLTSIIVIITIEFFLKIIIFNCYYDKFKVKFYFSNQKRFFIIFDLLSYFTVLIVCLFSTIYLPNVDVVLYMVLVTICKVINFISINHKITNLLLSERNNYAKN